MRNEPESSAPRLAGRLRGPTALLCMVTVLASCAWSVPADPGLNARLRGDRPAPAGAAPAPGSHDPGAAKLYYEHCGRCHEAWHPTHLAAPEWPRYVRRYGPRAGLFGESRARVLRWLQANAR